jgi:hypothetical protein
VNVKEHQSRGAWHYHMIISLSGDVRTGFDFDLYDKWLLDTNPRKGGKLKREGTFPTGSRYLRFLWSELGSALVKYGFGKIFTLEPIRDETAISYYIGKYISKHVGQRPDQDKGVRLINYSKNWVKNSVNRAWNTRNAQSWRSKVQTFALECGCTEFYQLSEKLGSTWAYKYQEEILYTLPTPKKFLPPPKEYESPFLKELSYLSEQREKRRSNKGFILSPEDDLVDSKTGEILF